MDISGGDLGKKKKKPEKEKDSKCIPYFTLDMADTCMYQNYPSKQQVRLCPMAYTVAGPYCTVS